jgi:ribonuclease HI
MKLEIFTDGACSGNPGPAGIGVVIKSEGKTIKEISKYIGEGTNNIAEYTALICALIEAKAMGGTEVEVKADSELMVKQVTGKYRVQHENIIPLFEQVKQLKAGFKRFSLTHIRRELNKEADKLSVQGIKAGRDDRPDAAGTGEESPSSKG